MLCVLVQMSSLMSQDMLQRWTEDMGLSALELRGMAVYVELGLLTSYAHMGVVEVSVEVWGKLSLQAALYVCRVSHTLTP